ncbi:MAG: hypothetical protein V3W11_12965 [bacterium]
MAELTFSEALRLGGVPTYISLMFGIMIIALIISGFITVVPKARKRPRGPAVAKWSWTILICGFVCALNGSVGTFLGMHNVYRAAAAAGVDAGAVMAQGVFEVLFNVAFSFMFAWLAFFGYATMWLVAARE